MYIDIIPIERIMSMYNTSLNMMPRMCTVFFFEKGIRRTAISLFGFELRCFVKIRLKPTVSEFWAWTTRKGDSLVSTGSFVTAIGGPGTTRSNKKKPKKNTEKKEVASPAKPTTRKRRKNLIFLAGSGARPVPPGGGWAGGVVDPFPLPAIPPPKDLICIKRTTRKRCKWGGSFPLISQSGGRGAERLQESATRAPFFQIFQISFFFNSATTTTTRLDDRLITWFLLLKRWTETNKQTNKQTNQIEKKQKTKEQRLPALMKPSL